MNDISTAFTSGLSFLGNLLGQANYIGYFILLVFAVGLVVAVCNIIMYVVKIQ